MGTGYSITNFRKNRGQDSPSFKKVRLLSAPAWGLASKKPVAQSAFGPKLAHSCAEKLPGPGFLPDSVPEIGD
jgi:hypothetical protein